MTTETYATVTSIKTMSTEALRFELTEARFRAANGDSVAEELVQAIEAELEKRDD